MRRLLVVDDDAITRSLLHKILSAQSYELRLAASGTEALTLFGAFAPDLVLLDVFMPGMDGFETCRRMREIDTGSGLPIVMMTADDDVRSIERAFEAGATDFITKPLHPLLLVQRLRYALRTRQLDAELSRSRLRQASACRAARLGFWEWDQPSNRLSWTGDLRELAGLDPGQISTPERLLDCVHLSDRPRFQQVLDRARAQGGAFELECRVSGSRGERLLRLVGEPGNGGRDALRLVGVIQDITDRRKLEDLIEELSLRDELTGLGNRNLFLQQVEQALEDSEAGPLMLGLVDLRGFKRLNEGLGEGAGDALLRNFAQRLQEPLREGEAAARVGGDEFALMFRAQDAEAGRTRFLALLAALSAPFELKGTETPLSFTAGLAVSTELADPSAEGSADRLLALAQNAEQLARLQLRDAVASWELPRERRDAGARLALERDLRRACAQGEFELAYQPQMDLRSGRIVGVEALVRWRRPDGTIESPADFIPVMEETGLVVELGRQVLRQAARFAAEWRDRGHPLTVAVNLSPRQFLGEGLVGDVEEACRAAGVPASSIELEITERLAMVDPQHSRRLLQHFRRLGHPVAIDDFGVGHSSLEYLLDFPISAIKVDRAFVSQVTTSNVDRAIVRAVAVIGRELALDVIAEGIETQRQCDFVEALGVNTVQGYLIARPMFAEALPEWMARFVRPSHDYSRGDSA